LWFDDQAEEAAGLYTSLFRDSEIGDITRYSAASAEASGRPAGSVMTVSFRLAGLEFTALNGGPEFRFTPAISFYVSCETADEPEVLFQALADGGTILMPLDRYPWSEKYGWVQDKYGVSWQLILGEHPQKIAPCLMFCGAHQGEAEEAMQYYATIFGNSAVTMVARYEAGETDLPATLKHAKFLLDGQEFVAMDSGVEQPFTFTEAISLAVNCDSREEVDRFWEHLSAVPQAEQCGWLKDRFGLSWQIIPTELFALLNDSDPKKAERVTRAMLGMKKIEIQGLRNA